ncbi:hypothetical protein L210DRAFT_3638962 [Boletus edulis BED1]|uniref:Uncharacterized protein n=1 Tax=Boletus edulis BED1 TaxID=1328754 RepID=A0AAD4CA00_BOLED|nr:hypothetical protein L210DRAFT_3638962 [Boletus edulis BED1]
MPPKSPHFFIPSISQLKLFEAELAAQRAKCHIMPSDTADAASMPPKPVFIPAPSQLKHYEAPVATQGATCHIMPSDTADAASIPQKSPDFFIPDASQLKLFAAELAAQRAKRHIMPSDTADAASMPPKPRTIPPVFIPAPSQLKDHEAPVATQGATCHIMPSDTADDHHIHARTRPECSLPFDESNRPHKKVKTLLTTISAKPSKESEDLRSLRVYQLARASRDTLAMRVNYHRLRVQEIDMMGVIARAELEEVEALLKDANLEVDEKGHDLCSSSDTFTKENLDKLASANPPTVREPFPELGPHDSSSNVFCSPTPSEDEYYSE